MRQFRAFAATFIISFSVMLCGFMAMYWVVQYTSPRAAGENQQGVPVLTPDYNDSKTTLLVLDCEKADFFFLLKLNALQNRVSLVSVPSAFYLSSAQRTLAESMEYAGIMQCVQDISGQFGINVDYHLLCDRNSLIELTDSFSGLDTAGMELPQSVKGYLLKGSEYADTSALISAVDMAAAVLDSPVGIEFLNLAGLEMIRGNMQNICDYAIGDIKENFSGISTNIGTQEMDRLKRITGFLLNDSTEFDRLVLGDEGTAQVEIDRVLKE